LVGDAGLHKDPITAQGITDAFRDADLLATAIDEGFSGRQPLAIALAGYEQLRRAAALPAYTNAIAMASFTPFPEEMYRARAEARARLQAAAELSPVA
jgi:2-polyprenyl-6-methoxyphenol hydroxylase-like FAD-dependent oxidoreductase